ncbi:MAG: T9SS C-terminal target domain-containing protein [Chitinophagaceae bacterium]|nr:MAG: T9SS C-terminal target domain-containing protein [Chitinophagaceae bacterium]
MRLIIITLFLYAWGLTYSQNCLDLSAYSDSYLQDVSTDDVTYPVGSAFISNNFITYVKPSIGNAYGYILGDTLKFDGELDIDVSTFTCSNKKLEFYNGEWGHFGIAVDNDTIFTGPATPPTNYVGTGWVYEYDGNLKFTITGDFNIVSLLSGPNQEVFGTCLSCEEESSCLDLSAYSDSYLQDVSTDDITYPVGSAFISNNFISYVKPSIGNAYGYILGDTLKFDGELDIDVSTFTCSKKKLEFYNGEWGHFGIAVDNDTIFTGPATPPTNYVGTGWVYEYDGNLKFTITGDFNIVSLLSGPNQEVFGTCLSCEEESLNIKEINSFYPVLYPNPIDDILNIKIADYEKYTARIYSVSGINLGNFEISESPASFRLSYLKSGIYFVKLENVSGKVFHYKIVKL